MEPAVFERRRWYLCMSIGGESFHPLIVVNGGGKATQCAGHHSQMVRTKKLAEKTAAIERTTSLSLNEHAEAAYYGSSALAAPLWWRSQSQLAYAVVVAKERSLDNELNQQNSQKGISGDAAL